MIHMLFYICFYVIHHFVNPSYIFLLNIHLSVSYTHLTDRFGRLNEKKNLDLIKMDARGTEILSLERYIDGVAQKADIFHHPVAFNPNEITQAADAREALVASLNKYAGVNLEYMAGLTGGTKDHILEELRGSIYFNPDINGYEIADKMCIRDSTNS